jgi:hypothetical protein
MKFRDLCPELLIVEDETTYRYADVAIADAQGVWFLCPKCFLENGSQAEGVHSVLCWTPGVPPSLSPGPGRWEILGTGIDDLTLRASSSSVQITSGCMAHFFVTDGDVRMC